MIIYWSNKMRNLLIPFLVVFIFTGCASSEASFDSSQIHKLTVGQTSLDEVEALFGQPAAKKTVADDLNTAFESQIYLYAHDKLVEKDIVTIRKSLTIEFVDDIVNGYIYNNSIDSAGTNFDLHRCDSLIKNHTTIQQAIRIFGGNYGVIKKPSNLFKEVLLETLGGYFLKSAEVVYVYFYSLYSENGGFGHRYKLLLLFFDPHGVLANYTIAENGRVMQNYYR